MRHGDEKKGRRGDGENGIMEREKRIISLLIGEIRGKKENQNCHRDPQIIPGIPQRYRYG